MLKKIIKVSVLIFVLLIVHVYLKNDGLYLISKINASEMELINKYAIEFPDTTIIEKFVLDDDMEPYIFHHTEYIKATLLVPNESIDTLFPEDMRQYNQEYVSNLNKGETEDNFWFGVWMPRTVVKWLDKTQRTALFSVMEPGVEYTRVYVLVDKLGWNIYKSY